MSKWIESILAAIIWCWLGLIYLVTLGATKFKDRLWG